MGIKEQEELPQDGMCAGTALNVWKRLMSFQAMIKPAQPAQIQMHCWGDQRFSRHAVGL